MHGGPDARTREFDFLTGGELARRMREHDWTKSPLGPPERWPQSLRSVVGLMLGSRYPMFVAWGPDLAFLYNDGYAPILGRKHPHSLGRPFQEVWVDIWADIEPLVAKALAGEATFHENLHLLMERNGYPEETWYSFSYSPVRDENGQIAGMFCACTETTAQVLADRHAMAERQKMARMFEQAPSFMVMLRGPEHRIEFTNPAYQRLIGHRDVLGKTVAEALPDAAAQGYVDLLDRVYRTGEALTSTGAAYAVQAMPGGPVDQRFVDFVYQPVRDPEGAVEGIFVEGSDVTDRVRAEIALRESEELNRRVLSSSDDCIKTLSLDGRLETMSEGGQRALGIAEFAPFVGTAWADAFEPEGRAAAHAAMAEARAGRTARFEAKLRTQAGVLRDWDTVLTPVIGDQGRPERILALSRDITARREAEALLRESEARRVFLLNLGDLTRPLSNPTEVVEATTRALGEYLGATRVAYAEIDEAAGRATTRGGWTDGSALHLPEVVRLSDFGGRLIARLRAGGTLRVDDVRGDEHTRESLHALEAIGARALVSVPLFKDGVFVVNLNVHQDRPRVWTDTEVELIRAVAERTWEAVERSRADAALRASERELQRLTDTLPVLVAYMDREVRYRFLNKAYEDWLPYRRDELLGQRVRDVVGEEAYTSVEHWVERALAGERVTFEQFMPYRAGGRRHIRVEYLPRVGDDGQVEGFYSLFQDVSEAKRVEAALRASEARLAAIFTEAPVGLSEVDLEGRFQSVNAALCGMLGLSRQDVVSLGVADITDPDDIALSMANFQRTIETGEPVTFDKRYVRRDGTTLWANSSLTRLDDEEGRPRGVLAVTVDLTERQAQEAALREETRTLETLNRTGAQLAGELDLDRLLQTVTDASVELTGARFGAYFHNIMDETGERLHLFTLSGADRASFEAMGRPRATAIFGPTFRNETIIRSDDIPRDPRYGRNAPHQGMPVGHLPVRSYLAIPVVSRTGEVLGGLIFGHPEPSRFTERHERLMQGLAAQAAIAIDNARLYRVAQNELEERRLAEARLRELNETLEQRVAERTAERDRMWDTSPDLMLVMDFEGYFRRVNPAWTTILGYATEELEGHHVTEFVAAEDHRETREAYQTAAAGGQARIVNRYRHKDGSTRWISWVAAPAADVTYATGRDITAEIERQAELAQAQDALRQSQKMEAMGQLTGGVAHDFNNLLTPIIGSLDLLVRRSVGSERERRLIDGALQSAERAKTLVQRLLAFARRQPLQPVAVDLVSLVHSMAGLIGSTLGPQIDMRVQIEPDLPPAVADPNQLEMALLNLAVNARDAMPEGGALTIGAARASVRGRSSELKQGHYVRLSVRDTGMGMDEATRARAIEPFFSTKGIGKGTGLGLSMVHGLAAQLGGGLMIESQPGEGTTVELWLPVSHVPAEADGSSGSAPQAQTTRGRALLVDDEDLVRMSTADMLTDLGYGVVEAGSAEEALRLLGEGLAPDLLVTDHLMPGMNGAELARQVRLLRPDLPVLIVSGYAQVDGIAPDLPRLTKPFRNAELAASLAALVPAQAG
ncbi:MAG TPA: PAS domain-containing protein [Microvirga sp.]|jgi:PAS domain S-box-containing protein